MNTRLHLHIIFWVGYYIICLYSELYLSESFSIHPTYLLFFQTVLAVFLLLCVKMTVVYFILYKLIPEWVKERKGSGFFLLTLLSLLIGALVMRFLMHFVIWPFVYEESAPNLNMLALIARYFYSFLDLLQIVGLAVCIKFYNLRLDSLKREKILVMERSKAEVLHLKSQTNPHFLFNTLNSIYSLAKAKSAQTADTVMRLSKILRYTLYDSAKQTISIGDEIKVIKDYIELQQLRFANRITMNFKTNLDSESAQITPLLLLPIVENAYKHCDENRSIISFELVLCMDNLILKTNNPVAEGKLIDNGTGLLNVKRQLELLYRQYSLDYSIANNQFNLELTINLCSYEGNELFDS